MLKSNWYIKCNNRERRRLEIQFPGKGKVDKWWWTQTDNHKRLLRCLSTTYSFTFCSAVPNGCLTTSLIYHAEAQGVEIDEVESILSGDLEIQGFVRMSETIRNGHESIEVTFKINSENADRKQRN